MGFKVKIRPYKTKDINQILDLVRELEEELAEKFPNVKIESGANLYRERYLKPGNKYKTWVAEVEGKIVGFLMGYPSLGAPEIDNMFDVLPLSTGHIPPEFYLQITYVSRPYRNRGISKALHRKVIEYARRQGYREVYACIAKWNFPELKVIQSFKFNKKDLGTRYRLTLRL